MKKILIIEDDINIAQFEKDYLEAAGYAVDVRHTGTEGLTAATEQNAGYALIILDIMLPGLDGFSVCKELVKDQIIPIIIISAKHANIDKIKALGYGAADYIIKPFEPSELVARVNAHIRRFDLLTCGNAQDADEIMIGNLRIEPRSRRVFVREKETPFPNKEFDLLLFLAQNANTVYSKSKLLDAVWGEDLYIDDSTVAVHINRIREKIEDNPSRARYIETLWGAGYRMNK